VRLRIEATPDELANKSEALVKALVDTLAPVAPDIAEQLEKAIPKETPKLIQPALRQMHEITRREYEKRLKWMVKDIGKVLDRAVMKKAEDDEPGEEPEKLEPGDIDPETGEEVPEEKEEELDEEEEEETE
jgi:hypothetical protein